MIKIIHRVLAIAHWALIAAVVLGIGYFGYTVLQGAGSVGRVVTVPLERADELRRVVLGWEQKPLAGSELEVAVAAIAAGVAIDSEGEPPKTLAAVQEAMIDAYLRYKKLHPKLSYQEIVEKSRLWLPDDWVYPRRWRDRPVEMLTRGRETTIERLKPVVAEKLSKKSIAPGCADRYLRPGTHLGGLWAGEHFAVFVEPAATRVGRMKPDPALQGKGFKAQFFCSQKP